MLSITTILTIYMSIPQEISVTKGCSIDLKLGLSASAPTESVGRYDCCVKLLGVPIKTVNVSVNPERYVIPSGEAIGVKIYTDGVLVVGTGPVYGADKRIFEPAKDAGIEVGDRITKVNGQKFAGTEEFVRLVDECKGEVVLEVIRDKSVFEAKMSGISSNGGYKLGLWVRDSTAGIGTMTFYSPQDGTFAALGHGICDSDTGDILVARSGSINSCKIIDVIKGKNGEPGELFGTFKSDVAGDIAFNCDVGIYGKYRKVSESAPVLVATQYQVEKGEAEVMCDIDGNGVKSYKIEITKFTAKSPSSNKDFVIKITDDELLEKTGGIVQGMSGSPIIQDGKLIGAVTHVFVNNPQKGYGIFVERMIEEAEKIR